MISQAAAAGTEQSNTLRPYTHGDTNLLCSFCEMGIDLFCLERSPGHRADKKRKPKPFAKKFNGEVEAQQVLLRQSIVGQLHLVPGISLRGELQPLLEHQINVISFTLENLCHPGFPCET